MYRPRRPLVARSALALCIALVASCRGDVVAPRAARPAPPAASTADRGTGNDIHFLQPAPDAPPIANPVIVFTATKGVDKLVKMIYQPERPGDSTIFAEFRVSQDALLSRPDGTPIAKGESVQITMTLVDAQRGIIDFQPSGLRFSPKHPATLKISYEHADPDLNHDGVVDQRDAVLRQLIHMMCRESPNGPWQRIPSDNETDADEVSANIRGFSGYIIDY